MHGIWEHTHNPKLATAVRALLLPLLLLYSITPWGTPKNRIISVMLFPYEIMPKLLCKPHYGNSHLEMVVCKWKAPN